MKLFEYNPNSKDFITIITGLLIDCDLFKSDNSIWLEQDLFEGQMKELSILALR